MAYLALSQLDSDRFGLNILRGTLDSAQTLSLDALMREIVEQRADITILRLPSTRAEEAHALQAARLPLIHADTLVYYAVNLSALSPAPLRNPLTFTRAQPEDAPLLESLVQTIFASYTSHYTANPHLSTALALQGYQQWAANHIFDAHDKITWIARRGADAVGFASCAFDEAASAAEGVLYGVHPDHSGGGVYGDLIKFTQRHFKDEGYQTMKVSTQILNLAVQKVWSREGFHLDHSFDTFHINTFIQQLHSAPLLSAPLPSAAPTRALERLYGELERRGLVSDALSIHKLSEDEGAGAELRAALIPRRSGVTIAAGIYQRDALSTLISMSAS